MDNMTAKVSCFARAYHYQKNGLWIFRDEYAHRILTQEEMQEISDSMTAGIHFFLPDYEGTKEDALQPIVEHQLAPSVLGRSAFCESALQQEVRLGCTQYVLFASGYDTYAVRNQNPDLQVFELDLPEMLQDKKNRILAGGLQEDCSAEYVACDLSGGEWQEQLQNAGFDASRKSFGSLLGISYYLTKEAWGRLLRGIADLFTGGSAICFDYPLKEGGAESARNEALASAANEQMKSKYSYEEMEQLLGEYGFLIYEHLDAGEMTERFFARYNRHNPEHIMQTPKGVGYLMAVKK